MKTGIDYLLKHPRILKGRRVGFLSNQRTLTAEGIPSAYALHDKVPLSCLLTPEHGWSGQASEGVIIKDEIDAHTHLSVFSLYGSMPPPLPIDTLVIDLQDVGLRCYTYAATCAQLLETFEGDVIVCDRPNPLGPLQQGPAFESTHRSLLSYLDIPFQHGLTMGSLLMPTRPLTIISAEPYHTPYAYPWHPPSPNLPSWDSVLLYPALVMLEGTNISEGRGTPYPFTSFGAPGLDHHAVAAFLNQLPDTGVTAHPYTFTPQRSKYAGKLCQGIQLVIEDYLRLNAFAYGTELLRYLVHHYSAFEWLPLKDGFFIDALMGTRAYREKLKIT